MRNSVNKLVKRVLVTLAIFYLIFGAVQLVSADTDTGHLTLQYIGIETYVNEEGQNEVILILSDSIEVEIFISSQDLYNKYFKDAKANKSGIIRIHFDNWKLEVKPRFDNWYLFQGSDYIFISSPQGYEF